MEPGRLLGCPQEPCNWGGRGERPLFPAPPQAGWVPPWLPAVTGTGDGVLGGKGAHPALGELGH